MGIEDITEAVSLPSIDLEAYKMSLDWLLNFTAANIPIPSSIAANFATANDKLLDMSTDGVLARNFQSILAFPFWFFNDNNWGNTALDFTAITPTLPPQFYTVAALVAPYSKIQFSRTMFYLFINSARAISSVYLGSYHMGFGRVNSAPLHFLLPPVRCWLQGRDQRVCSRPAFLVQSTGH
ncbi:hypothetical protein PG996_007421 [Apiospora saccharicola]|uniref:Uncharacterized protein n=1 Tax=Apiospora saccharicola TaxID=335842 RepID=A0ABR1VAT5_9PEZI